ncbi:MAG: hypothetical protein M0T84_00390 [Betaproteobacteria bacterium]|nr:hypothetical protein [Betaproteobacteria bacterium]
MEMGFFTLPNNSAILWAAPKDKSGLAGGLLNMMRSLGLIFGVDISGPILTHVAHRDLAGEGLAAVQHVFKHTAIPASIRDGAFTYGFMSVMGPLPVLTLFSTRLPILRGQAPARG